MKPVIVVEGKTDVQRLENLVDADFVICNGSAIDEETIAYIDELSKIRKVIIFTDPDYPGTQIRNKIASKVKNVYHAYVDRNKASNESMTKVLSKTEDIYYAEKYMEYAVLQQVYQASLQISGRILPMTLMDYVR